MQDPFAEDDFTHTGRDFMKDMIDSEEDELETCKSVFLSLSCSLLALYFSVITYVILDFLFCFQQKKPSKLKGLKKHKAKVKLISNHTNKLGSAVRSLKTRERHAHFLLSLSHQSKAIQEECEDPPGAVPSDFLSEAARVRFLLANWKVGKCGKEIGFFFEVGLLEVLSMFVLYCSMYLYVCM